MVFGDAIWGFGYSERFGMVTLMILKDAFWVIGDPKRFEVMVAFHNNSIRASVIPSGLV